ncbi:hypothetical protein BLNAU_9426 [Blattamonas nauphoetae]|uniref:Uncharacterized protein n=1 Tax=Blattamonas nauphoetae TaxID=2049346 RepID=A0ABQ9XVR5_9EUKA|nr:hypothetical protein BLNAU_9426 [Blattamonas nauphoetae]
MKLTSSVCLVTAEILKSAEKYLTEGVHPVLSWKLDKKIAVNVKTSSFHHNERVTDHHTTSERNSPSKTSDRQNPINRVSHRVDKRNTTALRRLSEDSTGHNMRGEGHKVFNTAIQVTGSTKKKLLVYQGQDWRVMRNRRKKPSQCGSSERIGTKRSGLERECRVSSMEGEDGATCHCAHFGSGVTALVFQQSQLHSLTYAIPLPFPLAAVAWKDYTQPESEPDVPSGREEARGLTSPMGWSGWGRSKPRRLGRGEEPSSLLTTLLSSIVPPSNSTLSPVNDSSLFPHSLLEWPPIDLTKAGAKGQRQPVGLRANARTVTPDTLSCTGIPRNQITSLIGPGKTIGFGPYLRPFGASSGQDGIRNENTSCLGNSTTFTA